MLGHSNITLATQMQIDIDTIDIMTPKTYSYHLIL